MKGRRKIQFSSPLLNLTSHSLSPSLTLSLSLLFCKSLWLPRTFLRSGRKVRTQARTSRHLWEHKKGHLDVLTFRHSLRDPLCVPGPPTYIKNWSLRTSTLRLSSRCDPHPLRSDSLSRRCPVKGESRNTTGSHRGSTSGSFLTEVPFSRSPCSVSPNTRAPSSPTYPYPRHLPTFCLSGLLWSGWRT